METIKKKDNVLLEKHTDGKWKGTYKVSDGKTSFDLIRTLETALIRFETYVKTQ